MEQTAEQTFEQLVALAKDLKARDKLATGVEFYIDETNRVDVKPLRPADGHDINVLETASRALAIMQRTRATISNLAPSADQWNSSYVGRALSTIEEGLRQQNYKMEDCIEKGKKEDVYNVLDLAFFMSSLVVLGEVVTGWSFRLRGRRGKLWKINQWGAAFLLSFQRHSLVKCMSMTAETIILVDKLRQEGRDVSGIVSEIGKLSVLEGMREILS